MTGSNTNSNVLFSGLQTRTAEVLGYSLAVILAAQNAGAGLASVIAPTKVVVGVSTAGMAGQEGLVMRKMFAYTGLLMLLVSALTVVCIVIEKNL
jgi:lactate permease